MFTMKGRRGDSVVKITWNAGVLTGDLGLIELVEDEARLLEGEEVGPVCGPITTSNHLKSGISAAMIIFSVFDQVLAIAGDLPVPPSVPKSAII